MMNQRQPLIFRNQPCSETVRWATARLTQAGLQVLQTFDSHSADRTPASCHCQHHGTDQCDCQMVILFVYGKGGQPISLMAHGYDGQTWLSMAETCQASNPALEAKIRKIIALSEPDSASTNEQQCSGK